MQMKVIIKKKTNVGRGLVPLVVDWMEADLNANLQSNVKI